MKNKKVYFLDSTVLMYAVGGDHPLREPCRKVLKLAEEGKLLLVTNAEIGQEIIYRYMKIDRKDKGMKLLFTLPLITEDIFPIRYEELSLMANLLKKYKSLESRDALHVASMLLNKVNFIITADKDFDGVEEVRRVDPGEIGL